MADRYTEFVNSGLGRQLASRLGLPRPALLRRYTPEDPLLEGQVLVLGSGAGADALASVLLDWQLDVRRHSSPKDRLAAIILVLDDLNHPDQLSGHVRAAGSVLRTLGASGRVITVSRPATGASLPAAAAARQAVDGMLRSVAKELRAGSTGNGILVADSVPLSAPGVLGALRFLLGARSAFVDGQFLSVSSENGSLPADWSAPLAGRTAVVTGAARGIGAAIARTLANDGATIVAVDVPAAGEQLAAVANDVRGTALQLDITAPDAGARILEHAANRHGSLDIVVHNAGITRDRLLVNMDAARWDSVLSVNLAAQLRMNEAFLASDVFRADPHIVSVASTSGIAGNRGQTNYAASKAGILGMVRATAPLMASVGGTINAVAPGFIETEMTARMPAATREVARRLNSLSQGGRPEDVAQTIAFLASSAAGGINGDVLRVCGQNLVGQ